MKTTIVFSVREEHAVVSKKFFQWSKEVSMGMNVSGTMNLRSKRNSQLELLQESVLCKTFSRTLFGRGLSRTLSEIELT